MTIIFSPTPQTFKIFLLPGMKITKNISHIPHNPSLYLGELQQRQQSRKSGSALKQGICLGVILSLPSTPPPPKKEDNSLYIRGSKDINVEGAEEKEYMLYTKLGVTLLLILRK